jgi:hypothetical protein
MLPHAQRDPTQLVALTVAKNVLWAQARSTQLPTWSVNAVCARLAGALMPLLASVPSALLGEYPQAAVADALEQLCLLGLSA